MLLVALVGIGVLSAQLGLAVTEAPDNVRTVQLTLTAGQIAADGFPASFSVKAVSRADRPVTVVNLSLVFFAGADFVANGRKQAHEWSELLLQPGKTAVLPISREQLVFMTPHGQVWDAGAARASVTRSAWLVFASASIESDAHPEQYPPYPVRSNTLDFGSQAPKPGEP